MNKKTSLYLFLGLLLVATLMFLNLLYSSKAVSYLSSDPKACINCHVMNAQYASWQHSSHANRATCVDCHLPPGNGLDKLFAKARDGWNHSFAFTFGTIKPSIRISLNGETRVQKNCIRCHATLASTLQVNSDLNGHSQNHENEATGQCWDCHREVPHGTVRAIHSVPYNLAVKEIN